MSAGVRVPLATARAVAEELIGRLAPACERIEVGGSVRRRAAEVGDLELVAISKTRLERDASVLFGEPVEVNLVDVELDVLRQEGVLTTDGLATRADGERYRKSIHRATGLQVDLFIVRPPATWGCLFLIRTGPADYSHRFVTDAKRRGFHFKDGQLHRGGLGCGSLPCELVPTPDEKAVYGALQLAYVPPEGRA